MSQDGSQCRQPGDGWTASGPGIGPGVPTTSPESGTIWDARAKIMQATYSSTVSNRVLVEAGYSSFWTQWGDIRPEGAAVTQIPVTEQSTTAGTPNVEFHLPRVARDQRHGPAERQYRASISYVTGSHSLKAGYQGAFMVARTPGFVGQQISYRFNNGVPNQLTQRVGPTSTSSRTLPDAFFVQDQWTRSRLTLQGGLRYEHVRSYFPEGENGVTEAHRFGPAFTFPRTDGVTGYHDITPRMGASYDVFGTGKTALKVSFSKYLQAAYNGDVYTINNPGVTLVHDDEPRLDRYATTTRVADCDFMNPGISGECGAWTNLNWGLPVQTTTVNPDVLYGWGKRNCGLAVQRRRAARDSAACLGRRHLQPPAVGQLLRDAKPRADGGGLRRGHAQGAARSAAPRRRRLSGELSRAQQQLGAGRDRSVLHRGHRLRRGEPLLARRRYDAERAQQQRA